MRITKQMLLGLGAAALMLVGIESANAATTADVIFIVDESGSMSGEHAWLGSMVTALEANLATAGVTGNNYGLVGYGGSSPHGPAGHKHLVGGGDFGTAAQLSTATGGLTLSGGTEDGWQAINYALNNYTFRAGAALNIILITDEDRDNTSSDTYASTLAALTAKGALLNVVVNASFNTGTALGIDSTGNKYVADGLGGFTSSGGGVATSGAGTTIATGGAAWDLNKLRAGGLTAASFTEAFVDIKTTEIVTGGVPDGGSALLLLSLSLGGLATLRRRLT
jgi:VPDSG-CTERM motif/von Willebrand factor type A domain